MKLAANPFTRALRDKQKQIGLWVSLSDNYVAEAVATAGFDWVVCDMEHSPNTLDRVLGQLQAFAAGPSTAIVRVPWNDPVMVKRLLDIGPPGLLFPMIQSADEAERAVAATRYPPRGVRGVAGTTRANAFGRITDYYQRVEDELAVLVQIETRQALENAAEIAAVDGVTGVFFGPADIGADIGHLGTPLADEIWALIRPVAAKLIERGVAVGTLAADAGFAAGLLNEGFTFVACGSDAGLLARGADNLLASVKRELT